MTQYNIRPEYQIEEELIRDHPTLISIGNKLMERSENVYIDVEKEIRTEILSKVKERNITYTNVNKVINILHDDIWVDDEALFCYEDWLIPFENYYYNVRKGLFQVADDHNFFYTIPHKIDRNNNKDCIVFYQALKQWLGTGNIIKPSDIFEIMGYCMTMNTNLKRSFFFYGLPDTGKSAFLRVLLHIIGKKNRANISLERMTKDQFGTDGLQLKILNMVGDHGSEEIHKIGIFKEIVGGDEELAVERKGMDKGKFRPCCKLVFAGNKIPKLKEPDQAFFKRWILVNFDNDGFKRTKIPFERRIIEDPDEVNGILIRCLLGVRTLYERGGFRPEITDNVEHLWNYNSNNVYRFVHEKCVFDETSSVPTGSFYDKYVQYVVKNKIGSPFTKNNIGIEMLKMGIISNNIQINNNRRWRYEGIRWKEEDEIKPPVIIDYPDEPPAPKMDFKEWEIIYLEEKGYDIPHEQDYPEEVK